MFRDHTFRVRALLLIVCSLSSFAPQPALAADESVYGKMAHILQVNRETALHVTARLASEQQYLDRLRSLHERGFASWLELARQQAHVDSLSAQLSSFRKYNDWVEYLCGHADRLNDVTPMAGNGGSELKPILLRLPGSMRLLGWIRPGSAAYEQLISDTGLIESFRFGETVQRSVPDAVSNSSHRELELAIHRMAWTEANATGRQRIAQINLRRQLLRADAVKTLHHNGFASESDLASSRRWVEQARAGLNVLHDQRSALNAILLGLGKRAPFDWNESLSEQLFAARLESDAVWSDEIVGDRNRLNYLLDLRRQYYDLAGQHGAGLVKLKLQQEYLARLQKAVAVAHPQNSAAAAFQRNLTNGERRQVEMLKLEIELQQARIQDFDERLAILALEEKRFIWQCAAQDDMADHSLVYAVAEPKNDRTDQPRRQANRFSYLERGSLLELDCTIAASYPQYDYANFTFEHRTGPLLTAGSQPGALSAAPVTSRVGSRSGYPTGGANRRANSIVTANLAGERNETSIMDRRFATYTSQRTYPFGILRSDLRDDIPAGYTPFYLPGWPTNLREPAGQLKFKIVFGTR